MAGKARFLLPNGGSIRDPLSNQQDHGRVFNPPRFPQVGGFSGPNKGTYRNSKKLASPGESVGYPNVPKGKSAV